MEAKSTKVKVGNLVREVKITKRKNGVSETGYVGSAWFSWGNRENHLLPFVKLTIIGAKVTPEIRQMIRSFILKYEEMLAAPAVGPSPMHFEEGTKNYISAARKEPQRVSGVPLWMTEGCKVWTECRCTKTGKLLYLRRSRFKQDSREIVEKYLQYCQGCNDRATCQQPCLFPGHDQVAN